MGPRFLLLAAALAMGTSCQNDWEGMQGVSKPGIDPPLDELFFPTGLAVTPDGRYLVVASSNADIKYNGGVLGVANLVDLNARLLAGPSGGCVPDARNPALLDCEESDGIMLPEAAVRVGNFPAEIALLDRTGEPSDVEPGAVSRQRLFVTVRGNHSLTYADLLYDGAGPQAHLLCISCGEGCGGTISDCDEDHVVTGPTEQAPYVPDELPEEPYGLFLDPGLRLAYVTHLADGSVSLFDLSDQDRPVLRQVLPDVVDADLSGYRGSAAVVSVRPGDPDAPIFVGARTSPEVVALRLQSAGVLASQCEAGFCHGRVCSECGKKEDCPGAQKCVWNDEAGLFACRGGSLALGEACTDDADCASGFCVDQLCSDCASDEDCPGELSCILDGQAGYHRCNRGVRYLGDACTTGTDCQTGFCVAGRCAGCASDGDCPGEERCLRGATSGQGWAYRCTGGMGPSGKACRAGVRSPTDLTALLAVDTRLLFTMPSGPMTSMTAGDVRGLAALPDGSGLVAVSRKPPALVLLDVERRPDGGTGQVRDSVELCSQPTDVAIRSYDGWNLAYVTCWGTGEVWIVDLDDVSLLDVVPVGKGPHAIVFAPDEPWIPPELRYRAYVSNFAENTVAVLDVDPSSVTWNRVIGKLGLPEEAVKQ